MNAFDVAYAMAGVVAAPWLLRKHRAGWRERFGHVDPAPSSNARIASAPPRPRVLLHAVSVGEVNTLRSLVPLLCGRGLDVIVSATTDTGIARARAIFEPSDAARFESSNSTLPTPTPPGTAAVVRYPLDFSRCVRRFLDAVDPDLVALVELEVWPNFVRECARRGIPVGVINGRLSDRSFRGYRRARTILSPMFARLRFAAVQDESYAERFRAMGVAPEAVRVTGSMKWDSVAIGSHLTDAARARASTLARAMGIREDEPLVVAGSTGPGEEELLHTAVPPGVQLLCAPRKPERFDEAARALVLDGASCVRRSEGRLRSGANRFLLDTIGELRDAYALADVVVVGRSFCGLHGSDPVEPASMEKPVVIGPEYSDFQHAVDALARGTALRNGDEMRADARDSRGPGVLITSRSRLRADLSRLLSDPRERARLASAGLEVVRREQGATTRHAELICRFLSPLRRGDAIGNHARD